ncbi:MAG TPA: S41 family peptidase, partial [bacterium]|nr:S41 family peptidase [bacterium]
MSAPKPSRLHLVVLLVLAVALVGAAVGRHLFVAQSEAASDGQGRRLLEAVAHQVRTVYIKRDVSDAQLYRGAAKALLAAAGESCAKLVAEPAPTGDARAQLYALLARVEQRCPVPGRTTDALYLAAAKGMLDSLGDPYTRLMEPEAFKMFLQDTQGFFTGIGIYIDVRDDFPLVVQPIEQTPAHRAGLRAGDRIIEVDGVSTKGISLQEAVTRIRGPAGTTVRLRLRRGDEEFTVSIVRARIEIVAAQGSASLDPALRAELGREGIGYVRLVTFNHERADTEFDRFVAEARRSGAKALIFDLRTNGGGLLDQAVRVASRFVPTGQPVLHIYDRNGRQDTARAMRAAKVALPTVVLVNEFSASASEIVAGALQDSGTATIVGVNTFGKNLIQSIVELPMGAGAAITSAKWLTPKNQDVGGKGLTPNVIVGEREEALRQRLKGQPEAEIERRVQAMQAAQLRRALEILKRR